MYTKLNNHNIINNRFSLESIDKDNNAYIKCKLEDELIKVNIEKLGQIDVVLGLGYGSKYDTDRFIKLNHNIYNIDSENNLVKIIRKIYYNRNTGAIRSEFEYNVDYDNYLLGSFCDTDKGYILIDSQNNIKGFLSDQEYKDKKDMYIEI